MNRDLILAGYVALAVAAVALELAARFTGRVPKLGDAVSVFNRTVPGRWLLLSAWLWAGWHFFVRARWG